MRFETGVAVALGSLWLMAPLSAADDACALLTQARASEVLGVSVDPGKHASETASGRRMCTWSQTGGSALKGKRVMVMLLGPMGQLTPADRFANIKASASGTAKTRVTGIGDDALLTVSGAATNLYVKKGASVVEVNVAGVPRAQTATVEKTLAKDAISKL